MPPQYLGEFLSLATIHFLAVVAPGPDFAITVSQSVRHGRRLGIFTAAGIGAGISVHVFYTLLGMGTLMHAAPWLLNVAKWLGAAYVTYLAWRLLRSRPGSMEINLTGEHKPPGGAWRAFLIGFLTNATNPKATLFFLAVFATIVSSDTPLKIQALYGAWMCIVNAMWFVVVSVMFSNSRIRNAFLRMGHWFERMMGVILVGFAIRLIIVE